MSWGYFYIRDVIGVSKETWRQTSVGMTIEVPSMLTYLSSVRRTSGHLDATPPSMSEACCCSVSTPAFRSMSLSLVATRERRDARDDVTWPLNSRSDVTGDVIVCRMTCCIASWGVGAWPYFCSPPRRDGESSSVLWDGSAFINPSKCKKMEWSGVSLG